ncbi:high mobility group box domain-containing protein, partial [Pseudomassariella vexata]
PRPANMFILFRVALSKFLRERYEKLTRSQISKIVGNKWAMLSNREKEYWKAKADMFKILHAIAHPGYKYSPSHGKPKSNPK